MRREARQQQDIRVASVQGYHEGGYGSELYAFRGFNGNWYFNSDRKEKTELRDGTLYRVGKGGELLPFAGYGLEIETECNGINRDDALADVFDKIIMPNFKFGSDMFKMQHDGSLGGRSSVEVITQVMTMSRIRNDYAAYKTMFDVLFPAFGISADSHNTSCGMHVNVSLGLLGKTKEEQTEAARKLYYIINKHYNLFCKALYRPVNRTHWCGQMDYNRATTLNPETMPNDHGKCLNYSHFNAGRIEIRLVGGQKDYYCFRNTMETIFHLVSRVTSIKWADCDDIVKIFSGCNKYVYKRLSTECTDYITSEQLMAIQAKVNTKDNFDLHR